jgi:hypothetical protein
MASGRHPSLQLPSFLHGTYPTVQRKTREEGLRCGEQYQKNGSFPSPRELLEVPPGETVLAHEVADFHRERPAWRLYMVSNVRSGLYEALNWRNTLQVDASYEACFHETGWVLPPTPWHTRCTPGLRARPSAREDERDMHGLLCLMLVSHTVAVAPRGLEGRLETGDLVFHTSRSRQSVAIQEATESPLSHVGLVEVTPRGVYVVEAVQPVQRVPFAKWKARGVGGHLLVLRPAGLTAQQRAGAVAEAKRHLGKPYDWHFGWGDEAMYCSELAHKAYAKAAGVAYGKLERLETLKVKALGPQLEERYGGNVPLELELLTPASLAADERLEVVHSDFPGVR